MFIVAGMREAGKAWLARPVKVMIVLACAAAALTFTVAVATGDVSRPDLPGLDLSGGSDSPDGPDLPASAFASHSDDGDGRGPIALVSTEDRVERGEALPCTEPEEPINFEIFSAGPSVAGVPLTGFKRRCGGATPIDEPPANFTNYFYGRCQIAEGDGGCQPPLQIQTWPACQRALADYSFEGEPIPYRELPRIGSARVVVIEFMFEPRIEVYTGSSTIVIFAEDSVLAEEALAQLSSQEIGEVPATQADELAKKADKHLKAPTDGATEGELQCQS